MVSSRTCLTSLWCLSLLQCLTEICYASFASPPGYITFTYLCLAAWQEVCSDWPGESPVLQHRKCWRAAAWPPSASSAPCWCRLWTEGCRLRAALHTWGGEAEADCVREAFVLLCVCGAQYNVRGWCHLSTTLAAFILSIIITCLLLYIVVVRLIPRLEQGPFTISTSRGPEACCTASETHNTHRYEGDKHKYWMHLKPNTQYTSTFDWEVKCFEWVTVFCRTNEAPCCSV